MANKTLELVFILDRSGSMCGMEEATVKGLNLKSSVAPTRTGQHLTRRREAAKRF